MSSPKEPSGRQSAGVPFPPPLVFVAGLGAAFLIGRRHPLGLFPPELRGPVLLAGWGLVAFGGLVAAWALLTFLRSRTNIMPNRPATRLVIHGPYRRSRNPMYVSLTALYLGVTLLIDSAWAALFVAPVLLIVRYGIVRREEDYLSSRFGEAYTAYRARVRRWL